MMKAIIKAVSFFLTKDFKRMFAYSLQKLFVFGNICFYPGIINIIKIGNIDRMQLLQAC